MNLLKNAIQVGNMSKARLEAFSDGVIAVIITVLVLEIHLPNNHVNPNDLTPVLLSLIPKGISYLISFITITVWWVSHHQLLHIIEKTDRGLLWLNSLFLLFLSFIPFPTSLIGEYPQEFSSILIYAATGVFTSISFTIMKWYCLFKSKLVYQTIPEEILLKSFKKGFISPLLYFSSIIIGYFYPIISFIIFAFIPCYYFIPGLLEKHIIKK
ncbi:TMEM175 family protein [Pigmentibacter ruber]|uniref:TMEM175 family protein n=1 Tax=Pigmentibacter ruber TaxID=2683196 RepID=UPI00131E70B9|nr:TMEM175 family protein [Pigmentibacter ruber]BFD31084.1 hypothetical protein GTC16762_07020 [Pigmentibacter ruber]